MGKKLHSCWKEIQKTRPRGKYGHAYPHLAYVCLSSCIMQSDWEGHKLLNFLNNIICALQLRNSRGHTLRCSHYLPSPFPEDTSLPCVVYCHGNSGCRADANEAAVVLLPSNITVFTLDFSGSGLSDGNYVSLGWHERDDLKAVVSYLRRNEQVSRIGLWGRSMGAVTSLLYGAEDPSIAGMVLDSAFSNLFNLMMELVDVYKIRLPKFTVKVALQYMRRVIQKKAKFDIMDINALKVAPKTFIPALFGHAKGDKFIQSHHSDLISLSYAGDKNLIKFDGDHNSTRPQFYYDLVSIFFHNVLRPPQVSPACSSRDEKYHDLGDLQVDAGIEEVISVSPLYYCNKCFLKLEYESVKVYLIKILAIGVCMFPSCGTGKEAERVECNFAMHPACFCLVCVASHLCLRVHFGLRNGADM
ncbi:hypothetical protein E3N88_05260 [Mikania micrantha]|uniref:Serine aminopeptidase S33 domain-containing protein n=1 Tax=Mikania micrantha TaxID=192012 RepID=A0A5N6PXA0_9ASTR|nr:hypothetical protein E3N88_05260 [Mikania micrantha]